MRLVTNSHLILSLKISGVLALCPIKDSSGVIQSDSLYLCLFCANYLSKFEAFLKTHRYMAYFHLISNLFKIYFLGKSQVNMQELYQAYM